MRKKGIPKRVTEALLVDMFACESQRDLFSKHYPKGMPLTRAELTRAKRRGLDVDWFALKLIDLNYVPQVALERWYATSLTTYEWLRAELKRREEKAKRK